MMSHKRAVPTDHDRPETYPVYEQVQRLPLAGDPEPVLCGVKGTGMDTYFPDGQILHHDLAGRLLRIAQPNVQWRRGLSGRMIELRRRTSERGGGLERRVLSDAEHDHQVRAAAARMQQVADVARGRAAPCGPDAGATVRPAAALGDLVTAAARFDVDAAHRDVAQFRTLYHDIPILPPDQYSSLVLVATDGCRYNQCTFCGLYRGASYHAKTPDEFQAHVAAALVYHGRSLALRRGIFLGQANALLGPRPWREEILRVVQHACELPSPDTTVSADWWQGSLSRFTGITSFLDAFVGARISAEEFAAMRQYNLRQIYIGMESGADPLLRWLRKPATAEHMVATVRAAKAGGLRVGVIVLVGAGGERFFAEHVQETVAVIRAMGLGKGDYVYLSPLVAARGAPYAQLAAAEHIQALTPARLAAQEQLLRQGLATAPATGGPYVARYDVELFVY